MWIDNLLDILVTACAGRQPADQLFRIDGTSPQDVLHNMPEDMARNTLFEQAHTTRSSRFASASTTVYTVGEDASNVLLGLRKAVPGIVLARPTLPATLFHAENDSKWGYDEDRYLIGPWLNKPCQYGDWMVKNRRPDLDIIDVYVNKNPSDPVSQRSVAMLPLEELNEWKLRHGLKATLQPDKWQGAHHNCSEDEKTPKKQCSTLLSAISFKADDSSRSGPDETVDIWSRTLQSSPQTHRIPTLRRLWESDDLEVSNKVRRLEAIEHEAYLNERSEERQKLVKSKLVILQQEKRLIVPQDAAIKMKAWQQFQPASFDCAIEFSEDEDSQEDTEKPSLNKAVPIQNEAGQHLRSASFDCAIECREDDGERLSLTKEKTPERHNGGAMVDLKDKKESHAIGADCVMRI